MGGFLRPIGAKATMRKMASKSIYRDERMWTLQKHEQEKKRKPISELNINMSWRAAMFHKDLYVMKLSGGTSLDQPAIRLTSH